MKRYAFYFLDYYYYTYKRRTILIRLSYHFDTKVLLIPCGSKALELGGELTAFHAALCEPLQPPAMRLTQKGEICALFEEKITQLKIFLTTAFGRVFGLF